MRTILVLVLGVALALPLYMAIDSMYGQFMGPGGLNPNFVTLISAWRAMGGTAQPLSAEQLQGAGGGMPSFGAGGGAGFPGGGSPPGGLGGRQPVAITDGLDLSRAPGQSGGDLLWLAVPAILGAGIEIGSTALTRRRREAGA
ncbi:MAG: hypothetical protein P4L93_08280 [Coriobacteriia bacterium]|nr:hypothetical protein [Coriobacteriia bacterium]